MQGLGSDSGETLGVESTTHLPWKCFPKEEREDFSSQECPARTGCVPVPGWDKGRQPSPDSVLPRAALIQEARCSWTPRQCAELIGSLEMHKPRLTVYLFSSSTWSGVLLHVFVQRNPSLSLPFSTSWLCCSLASLSDLLILPTPLKTIIIIIIFWKGENHILLHPVFASYGMLYVFFPVQGLPNVNYVNELF